LAGPDVRHVDMPCPIGALADAHASFELAGRVEQA
jgi:hypothetical protein